MNEEFLKKLQELKQQYVSSLPDLLEQIKADTNTLVGSGMNAVDMDEYYRLTHSLTGSGATYGFHEVSACSRKMENSIKELMEAEQDDYEQLIGDILVFCSLLEQTVNEAANSEVEIEKVSKDSQFKIDPWKILLADDDRFSREQLAMLLESNGHTVIQAVDGLEAIEKFVIEKPDLVIMDAVMPRMNGLDSAKKIKAESDNHFVPIIFLTALEREDDLVECIRCGGDDFIVKPFNRAILLARIFSMQRIQKLQLELEKYQNDTEQELSLARRVFDNVTQRNHAGSQSIVKWIESCGHFSGDVLCYRQSPEGDLYIMLGDFTGHGLRAAIGAIPASDIFYSGVQKNSSIVDICSTINQKLKSLLPTGQFMCGCFIRIKKDKSSIDIIGAGLPPVVIKNKEGDIDLLQSGNVPLGIVDSSHIKIEMNTLQTDNIAGVYAMSDGIVEAPNSDGEMYGDERLLAILRVTPNIADSIVELIKDFREYLGDLEADDDISIIGIPL